MHSYTKHEDIYATALDTFRSMLDDDISTPEEAREVFEDLRTWALSKYPEVEGPDIADALYDALADACPRLNTEI